MSTSIHSYKQLLEPDSLIFEMTKESGRIYSKAMRLNKIERKSFSEINKIMEKYCKENCKYLQSQSAQASYQSFIVNLKSYFKELKEFKKNPSKFSGKPRPPHRNKFFYKITFKKSAIRYKNGLILLSTKKPYEPIKIRWANSLPIPKWVIISYDKYDGWSVSFIMDKECKELLLDPNKIMSVDLGEKRVGTTFNNVDHKVVTYSGKIIMSLTRLRNKINGKIKSKRSNYKKKSRRYRKISKANKRIVKRIKNKQKDILHKYSRIIVDDAIDKKIGKIIFGDNSSTHNETNLGKNNQRVQQNPEQQLRKYIENKFERVGGTTKVVPEHYTSRTCPKCDYVKDSSPKGRDYVCSNPVKCDFAFDRDGVGAIGIMKKNVSFDHNKWLNVVGGLTPPIGVKYHSKTTPRLSLVLDKSKILDSCLASKEENGMSSNSSGLKNPEELEEPHML